MISPDLSNVSESDQTCMVLGSLNIFKGEQERFPSNSLLNESWNSFVFISWLVFYLLGYNRLEQ